jgi:hypothetical protein
MSFTAEQIKKKIRNTRHCERAMRGLLKVKNEQQLRLPSEFPFQLPQELRCADHLVIGTSHPHEEDWLLICLDAREPVDTAVVLLLHRGLCGVVMPE